MKRVFVWGVVIALLNAGGVRAMDNASSSSSNSRALRVLRRQCKCFASITDFKQIPDILDSIQTALQGIEPDKRVGGLLSKNNATTDLSMAYCAARFDKLALLQLLQKHMKLRQRSKVSPLFAVCCNPGVYAYEIARLLIEAGFSKDARDFREDFPLDIAVYSYRRCLPENQANALGLVAYLHGIGTKCASRRNEQFVNNLVDAFIQVKSQDYSDDAEPRVLRPSRSVCCVVHRHVLSASSEDDADMNATI